MLQAQALTAQTVLDVQVQYLSVFRALALKKPHFTIEVRAKSTGAPSTLNKPTHRRAACRPRVIATEVIGVPTACARTVVVRKKVADIATSDKQADQGIRIAAHAQITPVRSTKPIPPTMLTLTSPTRLTSVFRALMLKNSNTPSKVQCASVLQAQQFSPNQSIHIDFDK